MPIQDMDSLAALAIVHVHHIEIPLFVVSLYCSLWHTLQGASMLVHCGFRRIFTLLPVG